MSRKFRKTQADPKQLHLFDDEMPPTAAAPVAATPKRLYYATNAGNLRGILASGLIRPGAGWPKYTTDFQELTPGFIPFFVGGVPHGDLGQHVTRHDRNDLPVVVEFDAEAWAASAVPCVRSSGRVVVVDLTKLPKDARLLLLRGVIPLRDARGIHVTDATASRRFVSDCRVFANTRASLLPIHADLTGIPSLPLSAILSAALPRSSVPDEEIARQMRRLDSFGGILAAVTRSARDAGDSWPVRFDSGMDRPPRRRVDPPGSLDAALAAWIDGGDARANDPISGLLVAVLDFLAMPGAARGLVAEALLDAADRRIQTSDSQAEDRFTKRLQLLRNAALGDGSAAALFRGTDLPVMRGLLLFLLDPDYAERHATPSGCNAGPQDRLVAETLRGALHGWSRVPLSLRGDESSELAVGLAMARHFNRMDGALRFEAFGRSVSPNKGVPACG